MTAYVIARIEVTDPDQYEEYKKLSGPSLEPYGGRFIVRGGAAEILEGATELPRIVVLEFDTAKQARDWWASDGYAAARAARARAANVEMVVVEGV